MPYIQNKIKLLEEIKEKILNEEFKIKFPPTEEAFLILYFEKLILNEMYLLMEQKNKK